MTLIELTIASALLLLILAMTMGALYSSQSAQEFSRRRSATLDELRLAAAAFSRDARQARDAELTGSVASGCTDGTNTTCGSSVTFDTFVAGSPVHLVRWDFRESPAGSGKIRLARTYGGSTRFFADDLNSAAVANSSFFQYTQVTATDVGKKPTLLLQMNAKPKRIDPVVRLQKKVTFRHD
jgi:type II secretory pathway pseudopilin PulG